MTKPLLAILLLLPLSGYTQPPEGQDWWACQSVASSGLQHDDGEWRATDFEHDYRFILIAEDESLNRDSVAKAALPSSRGDNWSCNDFASSVTCYLDVGALLFSLSFDKTNGNGAMHVGDGSVGAPGDYPDRLIVTAFECAKG